MEWSMDLVHGRDKSRENNRNKKSYRSIWMPKLCRQRLLGYAESFCDLSKGFSDITPIGEGDRESLLRAQSLCENRRVVSDNFNVVAQIMERVAEEISEYEPMEERRRKILVNALADEGICIADAYYIPDKKGRFLLGLSLYTEKKSSVSGQDVADMLSVLLKRQLQLSVSSPSIIDREEKTFVFVEEAPYIVLTGFSRAVKDNENVSGDNYSVTELEKGRVKLILSDGTGSGEEACASSGKVLDLMEKMLETGYDADTAIHMVNTAFFAMGEECNHPTLDLCELDLYSGECEIRKVGAAVSFLKRGELVDQIGMGSLPLGILCPENIDQEKVVLKSGDYLIMMTDGVLDALSGHDYEETMKRAISAITEQNPGEIAERLLQTVLCLSGGQIRDDMTVLVAGVWKNSRIPEQR